MASPTQWTWVWVNWGSWWWTESPGVLQSMGSQRVGHNWATELNWTELHVCMFKTSEASVFVHYLHAGWVFLKYSWFITVVISRIRIFSIVVYYKLLNTVPPAIGRSLLLIYIIYRSVYLLTPKVHNVFRWIIALSFLTSFMFLFRTEANNPPSRKRSYSILVGTCTPAPAGSAW